MVNRSARQCDFAMREIERSGLQTEEYMKLINPFCSPTCSPTLMLQLRLYMDGGITVLIENLGYYFYCFNPFETCIDVAYGESAVYTGAWESESKFPSTLVTFVHIWLTGSDLAGTIDNHRDNDRLLSPPGPATDQLANGNK